MYKSIRLLSFIIALCLFASIYIGCSTNLTTTGSGNDTTTTQTTSTKTENTSASATSSSSESNQYSNINLESTFPIVKEKRTIELTFIPPTSANTNFDYSKNMLINYLSDVSNLDIKWTIIESAMATERVALLLSSDELPQAMMGRAFSSPDIVQYGMEEGMLRPINDLLSYCPELSSIFEVEPNILLACTATDGNIYGFPKINDLMYNYPVRMFINERWLSNLGLENPKTLNDFYTALKAFYDEDADKNGDVNNEIPWSGYWTTGAERSFIFNALGCVSNSGNYLALDYNSENTEVCYVPYSEYYVDYIKFMQKLWDESLLDPNFFTQSNTQFAAAHLNYNIGFSFMNAPYVFVPEQKDDYAAINALVSDIGKTPVWPEAAPVSTPANTVISVDCDDETAAVIANFIDCFYSPDIYIYDTYGFELNSDYDPLGFGYYYDEDLNNIAWVESNDTSSTWNHRTTYTIMNNTPGFRTNGFLNIKADYAKRNPNSEFDKYYSNASLLESWEQPCVDRQNKYRVPTMPSFYMSAEDLDRANELKIPLDDYVKSVEVKFITGELSIDSDYEEFKSNLESYGVKEYLEIYIKYYDMYKGN